MSQLGIGVMINRIFAGGEEASAQAMREAIGKRIASLTLNENDELVVLFCDGYELRICDNGQSCCESRYMRTDDNLNDYVGGTFDDAGLRDAPDVQSPDGYGSHEVQFLVIKTSRGQFVMSSHNEHNGYYGGFSIEASGKHTDQVSDSPKRVLRTLPPL